MMKNLYPIFLALLVLPAFGQVANKTVTDCNGDTRSIYGVLSTGKVLLVTSSGLDCSICMGAAPQVQSFAAANKGSVEVWGAMTFTYNSNNPTCTQVTGWVNNYSWTDVFAFSDDTRHWFMTGTPRYIVYDPADSSKAYEGPSRSQAFQTATSLANTVGLEQRDLDRVEVGNYAGGIRVFNLGESTTAELISLTGKLIKSGRLSPDANQINTSGLRSGIYLLRLQTGNNETLVRKVLVN